MNGDALGAGRSKRQIDDEESSDRHSGGERPLKKRKIVESSKQAASRSWNDYFAALQTYRECHGSCLVPEVFYYDQGLSDWVKRLRSVEFCATMSTLQRDLLRAIGFYWGESATTLEKAFQDDDTLFNLMLARVDAYRRNAGHGSVLDEIKNEPDLQGWYSTQVQLHKNDCLIPERDRMLKSIHLFDLIDLQSDHEFNTKYSQLCEYRQKHGHINVGRSNKQRLKQFLDRQRDLCKRGKLDHGHANLLINLGVDLCMIDVGMLLNQTDEDWGIEFEKLRSFILENHHFRVPKDGKYFNDLATWVGFQRDLWRNKTLAQDRFESLNSMGFPWNEADGLKRGDATHFPVTDTQCAITDGTTSRANKADDAALDGTKHDNSLSDLLLLAHEWGLQLDENDGGVVVSRQQVDDSKNSRVRETGVRKVSNLPAWMTKTVVKTDQDPAKISTKLSNIEGPAFERKDSTIAQLPETTVRKAPETLPLWIAKRVEIQRVKKEGIPALQPKHFSIGLAEKSSAATDIVIAGKTRHSFENKQLAEPRGGGVRGKVLPRNRGYNILSSVEIRNPLAAININSVP